MYSPRNLHGCSHRWSSIYPIRKWKIPVSVRALVTLLVIWAVFFGFFRLFIPLVASEAQELSNIDPDLIVQEFEGPIHRMEQWIGKLSLVDAGAAGCSLCCAKRSKASSISCVVG